MKANHFGGLLQLKYTARKVNKFFNVIIIFSVPKLSPLNSNVQSKPGVSCHFPGCLHPSKIMSLKQTIKYNNFFLCVADSLPTETDVVLFVSPCLDSPPR